MTPDQYTNTEQQLAVGNGHELYIHDWGNLQAATPIIQLHGGPGGSSKDRFKSQYDPLVQRIIFFDQRGAGRSTPYGSLEHNTTAELIHDITAIADHFSIDRFVIRGGSWGSCLALAYTLENPQRVAGLVLDGLFTGSKAEINWVDQGQFQVFYPDVWEEFLDKTPSEHHADPSTYHVTQLLEGNVASAQIYNNLEGGIMQLDDRRAAPGPIDEFDPIGTIIEQHYLSKGCFLPDRHIFENAHTITAPVVLVQGRYDMVCPPATAYELHQKLPNSRLHWTQNGHIPEHEALNLIKLHLELLTT